MPQSRQKEAQRRASGRRDSVACPPSNEARALQADLATGGAVGDVGRLVARVDDDAQPEVTDRGAAAGLTRATDRGGHQLRSSAVHSVRTNRGETVLTFGLHELLSGGSCAEFLDDHMKKQPHTAIVSARADVTTYQSGRSLGIPSPAMLEQLA